MRRRVFVSWASLVLAVLAGCRGSEEPRHADDPGESWAVTAWGGRYEVFAETDGLVAGQTAVSNAHVTVLADFSPLRAGSVTAVLRSPAGQAQAFRADKPKRDGIFAVELKPASAGEFDLVFRVSSPAGDEEIAAGRVRVGVPGKPGGLEGAAAPAPGAVAFLKEQQWRTPFATAWAQEGSLRESVSGPARVRPAGGGEAMLTAPADAAVSSRPWPHVGLGVAKGGAVFRLLPRVGDRSLPELQADAEALAAEADVARKRVERLEALLAAEATSRAELDRARAVLHALEARLAAARQGLSATRGLDGSAHSVDIAAPWAGRVAEVLVSPGQTVAAGAPLGRIVRVKPLWLEIALRPEDAARLPGGRIDVHVRRPGQAEPLALRGTSARFVSRAPEVDSKTASLSVIFELEASADELPFGSAVEADVLLPAERKGVVVPLSALVRDSGATVVYVQLEGEAFARRDVKVLSRQGLLTLVDGLRSRERVVTEGGGAVRRASLLSSGAPEGHVH